jgi:hypothetical protein
MWELLVRAPGAEPLRFVLCAPPQARDGWTMGRPPSGGAAADKPDITLDSKGVSKIHVSLKLQRRTDGTSELLVHGAPSRAPWAAAAMHARGSQVRGTLTPGADSSRFGTCIDGQKMGQSECRPVASGSVVALGPKQLSATPTIT